MESKSQKRLLIFTHEIPYPADRDGWSVITYPILKFLHTSYDIDLVFPISEGHPPREDHLARLNHWCRHVHTFHVTRVFLKRALTALFHPAPLVYTRYRLKELNKILGPSIRQFANSYQAVIVADSHCARFINNLLLPSHVRKIFIASDYITLMYRRIWETDKRILSRIYHWITYRKLRIYEPLVYRKYDHVVYVSYSFRRHR